MSSDKGRSGRDLNDLQESYSERGRERKIFLSIEKSATSLSCQQITSKEKKQLYQDSLNRKIIRDCYLKNRRVIYCLKHDPSCTCKSYGWKAQTGFSMNLTFCFTLNEWNSCQATQSSDSRRDDWLCTESEERERKSQRKGQSQVVIQHSDPHEAPPCSKILRTEETLNQERCAHRDAWEMDKHVHKLKEKGQSHKSNSPSEVLDITSAIFDETRGKRLCCRFRSKDANAEQEVFVSTQWDYPTLPVNQRYSHLFVTNA